MTNYRSKQISEAYCTDKYGKWSYQSGNDPLNPNGMKPYKYKGVTVWAYCYKDVPMRYKSGLYNK